MKFRSGTMDVTKMEDFLIAAMLAKQLLGAYQQAGGQIDVGKPA